MAALRHPNVLGFLAVCTVPPCVVSEYCSRGSLYDILRQAKASPAMSAELTWAKRLKMVRLRGREEGRYTSKALLCQHVVMNIMQCPVPSAQLSCQLC
jgi:hypothetical protein